ncbi:hypothetical protein FFF34_012010 [Inquilinus sp. KBS0705]|nr:hypothetical protein FFF34_012010 [Inquilinus sp. KBS0705]
MKINNNQRPVAGVLLAAVAALFFSLNVNAHAVTTKVRQVAAADTGKMKAGKMESKMEPAKTKMAKAKKAKAGKMESKMKADTGKM